MPSDSDSSVETARKLKKKVHKNHRDRGDRDKNSRNKRNEKRSRSSRRRKHHKHYRRSDRKSGRDDSDSSSSSSASSSSSDYRTRRKEKRRRRAHRRRRKESRKESDESSIEGCEGKSREVKRSRKSRRTDDCNEQKSDSTTKMSETKPVREINKEAHSDEKEGRKDNQPQKVTSNMKPMSKDEYEALQSTIREVYDPLSGRYRLVRGTGEIIERIVSRSDHERINQIATRSDGTSFSKSIIDAATRRSK
uniref:ADP-ribosylation factor-like protein 6-interacting protein 4 n=1 Tax=Chaetoceros debilis TaxID=122233 RepID=A0A7S3V451_9STRA